MTSLDSSSASLASFSAPSIHTVTTGTSGASSSSDSATASPSSNSHAALGTGPIAGIAVGGAVGLIAVIAILAFLLRRAKRQRDSNDPFDNPFDKDLLRRQSARLPDTFLDDTDAPPDMLQHNLQDPTSDAHAHNLDIDEYGHPVQDGAYATYPQYPQTAYGTDAPGMGGVSAMGVSNVADPYAHLDRARGNDPYSSDAHGAGSDPYDVVAPPTEYEQHYAAEPAYSSAHHADTGYGLYPGAAVGVGAGAGAVGGRELARARSDGSQSSGNGTKLNSGSSAHNSGAWDGMMTDAPMPNPFDRYEYETENEYDDAHQQQPQSYEYDYSYAATGAGASASSGRRGYNATGTANASNDAAYGH